MALWVSLIDTQSSTTQHANFDGHSFIVHVWNGIGNINETISARTILVGFFRELLNYCFFGYVLIPEGTLLEVVLKVKPDINSEEWDNFMGYVIFIGSAVVWGVTASLSKTWGEPH